MFTGIIESKGKINQIVENSEGLRLSIQTESNKMNLSTGESISVNGVCLTVISFEKNIFLLVLHFSFFVVLIFGAFIWREGNITFSLSY